MKTHFNPEADGQGMVKPLKQKKGALPVAPLNTAAADAFKKALQKPPVQTK